MESILLLRRLILLTFLLAICAQINSILAQTTTTTSTTKPPKRVVVKKYKRPNNLPKANQRINCPVCASDFMSKRVTVDDPCFNPRYNLTIAELELISECPLASRVCTTETVYVNGVLTAIKRKCGQACADSCVVAGLGLTSETCLVCCPPFEYDTYSTDHLKQRECA